MSILHSSVVHFTDLVKSLREALLNARRDTVTHRATTEARTKEVLLDCIQKNPINAVLIHYMRYDATITSRNY